MNNLKAIIINLDSTYIEIKAKNIFDIVKKLKKENIDISESDVLFLTLKSGYSELSDKRKLSIKYEIYSNR